MKCQSCGKKEATVRYKENINGKKQEIFLCEGCADKMGFSDFSSIFSPMFATFPNIFEIEEEKRCEKCGYTLEDYSKTGVFGCEHCYNTFSDTLDELFLKIHGKNRHIESKNKKDSKEKVKKTSLDESDNKENEIRRLEFKLKEMIETENYEEAAVIRDKIKELKNK